jgi:hypothetical protein
MSDVNIYFKLELVTFATLPFGTLRPGFTMLSTMSTTEHGSVVRASLPCIREVPGSILEAGYPSCGFSVISHNHSRLIHIRL